MNDAVKLMNEVQSTYHSHTSLQKESLDTKLCYTAMIAKEKELDLNGHRTLPYVYCSATYEHNVQEYIKWN